ncbi:MAG: hypothetical protein A3C22_02860 [Candidatus Levybacteria bacterium RIFCSPHIGHO2_02_FULL_37_10]|nr:MAG: hypothetical protein A3C22_02860 [Candidatus Levybacteria bacterium RIFCSPHIGHO2_02_FULL_37_10]
MSSKNNFSSKINKRPKVGIGIIVKKGNKILVGKRKKTPLGKGTLGFPGGHLEFGESFEDAVKREVFEETEIRVKNIKFASATNDIYQEESKHYITIYMTCDYAFGKVGNKEKSKCEGWEWISWNSLLTFKKTLFLPMQNLLKQNFNPFRNKE